MVDVYTGVDGSFDKIADKTVSKVVRCYVSDYT